MPTSHRPLSIWRGVERRRMMNEGEKYDDDSSGTQNFCESAGKGDG